MSNRLRVYAALTVFLTIAGAIVAALPSSQVFRVRDDCDPATFNAGPPVGPGAGRICNPAFQGRTTFGEFIQELTEDQKVGHWRFNPDRVQLDRGQRTMVESRAGELHTFTRVAEFGGGINLGLNVLSEAGETREECGTLDNLAPQSATHIFVPDGAAFAGPTAGGPELPRGTTKWQCCIHPWMRSEVTVR